MRSSIAEYYALRPGNYGPIVSVRFSQIQRDRGSCDGTVDHVLEIELSRTPDLDTERLALRFRGVSELHFEQPPFSLANFGLIELHAAESGFLATEEEGNISFRFKEFNARLVGRP